MADKKLHLKISTPERVVLDIADVDMVTAPGVEGEFGILPSHIPFATKLKDGIVKVKTASGVQNIGVATAFFEVNSDRVLILADHAILPSEADRQRAEQARARAQDLLEKRLEGTNFQQVEAELRKALLELHLVETLKS